MCKVHKPRLTGKPVVNQTLKFVESFFQAHAKSWHLYIKDFSDFIKKIDETEDIHKGQILITLDVKSLYIPNHERTEAVKSSNC